MSGGAAVGLTTAARQRAALVKRLTTLRGKWPAGNRPSHKPYGRWLGDFLDQGPDGLLPAELDLLLGCQNGEDVNKQLGDLSLKQSTESDRITYAASLHEKPLDKRKEFLRENVKDYKVRAKFLRFMILGGDKFAPVHEAGVQLWNAAIIGGELDLRSGKCVSRVELANCTIEDDFLLQDATLDVLVLSGSLVRGKFRANRASVSGAMWLDEYFISESEVDLSGIEIGGRLDCSYGHFIEGITAPGANIGGDLKLSGTTANATVSFVNEEVGGSMFLDEAKLVSANVKLAAVDFSRANVKGDVSFSAAIIAGAPGADRGKHSAVNAQNISVHGTVSFGGGFRAAGIVSFNGAEVAKSLDFSGGVFLNPRGDAITAKRSKVSGALSLQTERKDRGQTRFRALGAVSLESSACGELNCAGGRFHKPAGLALDCTGIVVTGAAKLCNNGHAQFEAFGGVAFYFAQIGTNLLCGGGKFYNHNGTSLNCQGGKIAGCVFLGAADCDGVDPKKLDNMAFCSDGVSDFTGATVGLQFNCLSGSFQNAVPDITNSDYAALALNLSASRIDDTLILGPDKSLDKPPTIRGSVDLTGATVRVLFDNGLINDNHPESWGVATEWWRQVVKWWRKVVKRRPKKGQSKHHEQAEKDRAEGLAKTVKGEDGKELKCNLSLDLFTYERLAGKDACDVGKRKDWLQRQPLEDLGKAFKTQPFEQLITVMRNMGYDDEADDIALFRRQRERRAKPLFRWWRPLRPLRDFLVSNGLWVACGAVLLCINYPNYFYPELFAALADAKGFLIQLWGAFVAGLALVKTRWYLPLAVVVLFLFRKFWAKIGEIAFLDYFIGYGFRMGRAVVFLLLLVFEFGWFYGAVFNLGAIEPADRDVRIAASQPQDKQFVVPAPADEADKNGSKGVTLCAVWSVEKCKGIADQAIPLFNQWLYSADVMLPIVSFGQKPAWAPTPHVPIIVGSWQAPSNFVYDVQIVETVLGWIEGFLLVSFVTGLISKGGGGKDQ